MSLLAYPSKYLPRCDNTPHSERLRDYVVSTDDPDGMRPEGDVAEVPVMPLTATLQMPAPPGLHINHHHQPALFAAAAASAGYVVPGAYAPAFYAAPPAPLTATTKPARASRQRSRSPPAYREAKSRRGGASGFASKHPGTSSYRGVSWHTQTSRWKAQIKVNGRDINLGRHKDEVAAARAYDRAAICARGVDGAKLNFAIDDYREELESLQGTQLDELAASLRGVEERMQAQTSRYRMRGVGNGCWRVGNSPLLVFVGHTSVYSCIDKYTTSIAPTSRRFHGVRLNKRTNKWEAYIRVNGKHVHLGCYDHEVAAAQAFDQAAIVRHAYNLGAMGGKPTLVTNFPPDYYQTLLEKQNQDGDEEEGDGERDIHDVFYKLGEKYIDSLVEKCQESVNGAAHDDED